MSPLRPLSAASTLLAIVGLALGMPAWAAPPPASLPVPGPGNWVIDQAGLLSPDDEAILSALGDQVNTKDGAALAVLTLRTVDGADPRTYATQVFNTWQLGDQERDNGILLFVAIDDRAAELVLGDGIDSDAEVAKSDRIMQDVIVARFRNGDNAGAIVAGARACAATFYGLEVPQAAESPSQASTLADNEPISDGMALLGCLIPVGGLGGLGTFVYWLYRKFARRRPRQCPKCQQQMVLLDEMADDAHLEAGERAEERVGSVDYDVWWCAACGFATKLRYGRWFTRFSKCARCNSVTTTRAEKTLQSATTSSTGLMEVHENCEHCGMQRTFTRTIPRVQRSSSSSSSYSGGGSSSGRGSSGRW